jgi:ankyrin repeat protein
MDSKEMAFFLDACRRGDTADVAKMCELFPDLVNEKDPKGFTPLIIAVYNNQLAAATLLLDHGADPDSADASGNTALMGACFKGFEDAADLLLSRGAQVNVRNGQGAPALTFAATFGQMGIARRLLERGADRTLADTRGKTPLDHARMQENEAMINLLQSG